MTGKPFRLAFGSLEHPFWAGHDSEFFQRSTGFLGDCQLCIN